MEENQDDEKNPNVASMGNFQIGDEGSNSCSIHVLLAKCVILKSQLNTTVDPSARLALLERLAQTGRKLRMLQEHSSMKEKAS